MKARWLTSLVITVAALLCTRALPAAVVISQVYGGGGNTNATYSHDFVELFNNGTMAASLTGWSVQYASAAGSSWSATNLSGVLQPGQHFLVQEASGGAVGILYIGRVRPAPRSGSPGHSPGRRRTRGHSPSPG